MRMLISGVVLALALTACSGNDEAAPAVETVTATVTSTPTYLGDPTAAVTETPTEEADPFAPNVGDRALRVGQPRVGSAQTTVLLETDLGISDPSFLAGEGNKFFGLRISTCVRKNADDAEPFYSTYPGEWYAVTKSGNEYTINSSYPDWPTPKYPENVTIPPGSCLKGWLALEVPQDENRFEKIVFRPGGETVAEWLL